MIRYTAPFVPRSIPHLSLRVVVNGEQNAGFVVLAARGRFHKNRVSSTAPKDTYWLADVGP